MSEQLTIRDMRKSEWFWADSAILKNPMPASIKLVYLALCVFANQSTQSCYPKLETISSICGLSKRSVIRGLNQLIRVQLVSVKRSPGRGKSNEYTLLQVKGDKLSLLFKGDISLHKKVTKTTLKGDTTAPPTILYKQTKEQSLSLLEEIRKDLFKKGLVKKEFAGGTQ